MNIETDICAALMKPTEPEKNNKVTGETGNEPVVTLNLGRRGRSSGLFSSTLLFKSLGFGKIF